MTDASTHLPNDPNPEANPLEERLREQHVDLYRRLVQLEEKASEAPAEVTDDATAQTLTSLAGDLAKLEKDFEAARVDAKEPYLQGSRTVDDTLGAPKKTLESRRKVLLSRINAHNDRKAAEARRKAQEAAEQARWEAEEQRRAAEAARAVDSHQEADQLAQDAAKVDAQADAQEKKAATTTTASVKTESGTTAYQVKTPAYRIPDGEALKASLGPLVGYLSRDAIADALSRAAKANPTPTIPGVEFYIHTESRVRAARGA
jgi:hypothetical protein